MAIQLLTKEEIEKALRDCHGLMTQAARALGVSRQTLTNYLSRYPELNELKFECRSHLLDLGLDKLEENLKAGNVATVLYTVSALGRDYGFGRRLGKSDEFVPMPESGSASKSIIDLGDGQTIEI